MKLQKQPLVSVIVPFLNEELLLKEAVESVLSQTYTSWELILVDDGSTDASSSIAQKYAADYEGKIFYYEHEGHVNKGLSASRNKGIEQAQGDFIAFLDADDVWLPSKLLQQLNIFNQYPETGMLAEAYECWFSWLEPEREDRVIAVGVPQDRMYQPPELVYRLYPLNSRPGPCPSSLMVTRKAIANVGGFEEGFTHHNQLYEDQAFLIKIYLKENVYVSSACNIRYRQRKDSIVSRVHADGHYLSVRKYFLEWLQMYLQQEHITDKKIMKLLKKAWLPYHHPQLFYLTSTLPARLKLFVRKGVKKIAAYYG